MESPCLRCNGDDKINKNLKCTLRDRKTANYSNQSTKERCGDAEESSEGKINFSRKTLRGVVQGNAFQLALKGGKYLGSWKLTGSLVSCISQTQRRASLPTPMQRKESRGVGPTCNTLSRKSKGLPFIINRTNIRSFFFIRFQSSNKALINNSLFLSVIFICKFSLDFENTSRNRSHYPPLSIFIWEIRQAGMIILLSINFKKCIIWFL